MKTKEKNFFLIIILMIMLVIRIITWIALARYVTKIQGSDISSSIAKPICTINVIGKSIDEINPYCDIEVCNYDEEGSVSQVAMNFSVDVMRSDGTRIDDYYWEDSNGNNIGQSLEGVFDNLEKTKKTYRIYFFNSGETEKEENIKFSLKAIQKI